MEVGFIDPKGMNAGVLSTADEDLRTTLSLIIV